MTAFLHNWLAKRRAVPVLRVNLLTPELVKRRRQAAKRKTAEQINEARGLPRYWHDPDYRAAMRDLDRIAPNGR